MGNFCIGDYVVVTLMDGTVFEGEIVRIGNDNIVVDDVTVFGDWVFIEFRNIREIMKLSAQELPIANNKRVYL